MYTIQIGGNTVYAATDQHRLAREFTRRYQGVADVKLVLVRSVPNKRGA